MSSFMYPLILKTEKFLIGFPHWQHTAAILQLKSTCSLKVVIQSDLIPCSNKYFSFSVFVFRYSNSTLSCGLNQKTEAWCLSWPFEITLSPSSKGFQNIKKLWVFQQILHSVLWKNILRKKTPLFSEVFIFKKTNFPFKKNFSFEMHFTFLFLVEAF